MTEDRPEDEDALDGKVRESRGPSDELFKQTFQSTEHAAALLRSGLPLAVSQRIDWGSLEQVPTEHIDEWFDRRYSDVLFRARISGQARRVYIDVLLEHQSSSQRMMVLRMLGMMARRSEALLRQEPTLKHLPIVLPVVLYQGDTEGRGWRHAVRLRDILDADAETLAAFAPFIPDFEFALDDLTEQSIDDLHARSLTSLAYATLRLLRDGRTNPGLLQELESPREIAVWLNIAGGPQGHLDLTRFLLYLYRTVDAPKEEVRSFARKLGSIGEDAEMTAADRLIASVAPEIRAQGRAEGKAEGVTSTLRRQLELKFGPLDTEVDARIRAASLNDLERWSERILSADSIAAVFGA